MERFWSETNMGKTEVSHAECHKAHEGGKVDGCQEFLSVGEALYCSVCGCHMNYHRKVAKYTTEVVYTECHKNHRDGVGSSYKDGCKEFVPGGLYDAVCAACGCHKSFHRNEVTKEMGVNTERPDPAVEESRCYPVAPTTCT